MNLKMDNYFTGKKKVYLIFYQAYQLNQAFLFACPLQFGEF